MTRIIKFSLIIFATSSLTSNSYAQVPENKILSVFEKCRDITADQARLACYDGAISQARIVASNEREKRIERRKEDFGLSEFQIEDRTEAIAESDPEEAMAMRTQREEQNPSSTESKLVSYSVNPKTRKSLFLLENGQFWAETSNSSLRRMPNEGTIVKVSKAPLGGFRLTMEGRNGFVNVKRVR